MLDRLDSGKTVAPEQFNREAYDRIAENSFLPVAQHPLSTFSIDVDTASYANIRRFLTHGAMPPPDAVRIEEMVNYFRYNYPQPEEGYPFSVNVEVADCPWNPDHLLARIGLKGYEISYEDRPPSNLVFLIDVSGSMRPANKLPLLKLGMRMRVNQRDEYDRVAIVVYAGASGLVLPSTSCRKQETILSALERLNAGGSTNGGAGIRLAYDVAVDNFIDGGTNRVILATDGDFNVGTVNFEALKDLIEEKRKTGISLTTLGFGRGNYNDHLMEQLADAGNGNYAYIDTLNEAQKVLVDEIGSTLNTIAKDVKIQVEFNPDVVSEYRLIGYENRALNREDFNNDKVDAGELGAGYRVTALYELSLVNSQSQSIDPLRYQATKPLAVNSSGKAASSELASLRLRYKLPESNTSTLIEHPIYIRPYQQA